MNRPAQDPVQERQEEICQKHGPFTFAGYRPMDFITRCPDCQTEKERQWEREQREEYIARLVKNAHIPTRYCCKTLSNFEATTDGQRHALLAAQDYTQNFADHLPAGRCLVFCGTPGTGKTHLACAIAWSLAQSGRRTRYVTVAELIRRIRDTWHRDAREKTDAVLQEFRTVDLLVLDEVGLQFGTDGELTQLTEVLDMRYRDLKPTLIVSNCTPEQLNKFLGDRGVDRLRENGGRVLIFDWPSHRGANQTAELNCG